ncbi:hypothetical protein [Nocardiopsis exhalans]|uniref:hypothetical protein n=1 Tax=Nocardiopsis exhalans TaxID=163604 RepID=UPI0031D17812
MLALWQPSASLAETKEAIPDSEIISDGNGDIEPLANDSKATNFGNGARLVANVYIASYGAKSRPYRTSAIIENGPAPRSGTDWVRNTTTFSSWGISSSLDAFGQSGSEVSTSWTNNNGARGSYLSGNVIANAFTFQVTGTTTGFGYYYGMTRSATASTSTLT